MYDVTTRLRNGGSTLGVLPGGDPPAAFTTSPSLPFGVSRVGAGPWRDL